MGDYVVYKVTYSGDKHPPYYIGSTHISKIRKGYIGSVSSLAWKGLFLAEKKANRHLYSLEIMQTCETRKEALEKELEIHILYDVVKNPLFYNEALACPNGFFGRDVSGSNNPRFGKECPANVREACSSANLGKVVASCDNGISWQYISVDEFWDDRDKYITPKGEFNHSTTMKTRERVAAGVHHFCDPDVQRKMHEKRRVNGFDVMTQAQKDKLSAITTERLSQWKNKLFTVDSKPVWLQADILYKYYMAAHDTGLVFTPTGKILRKVSAEIKAGFKKETGLDLTTDRFSKFLTKFKSGWNPNEDTDYKEWQENESKKYY